jgi:hypothetical protein
MNNSESKKLSMMEDFKSSSAWKKGVYLLFLTFTLIYLAANGINISLNFIFVYREIRGWDSYPLVFHLLFLTSILNFLGVLFGKYLLLIPLPVIYAYFLFNCFLVSSASCTVKAYPWLMISLIGNLIYLLLIGYLRGDFTNNSQNSKGSV